MVSLAAPHAKGKKSNDVIFGASAAAKADIQKIGAEHVVNATVGTILDDDEKIVCLPVVERVFKSLPMADIISYAPIAGTPKYLEDAQAVCFGSHRPDAYTAAISTTGGTGGIHHAVHNYTSPGDEVLTSDWYWGAYKTICEDNNRKLRTYKLFDEDPQFNRASFEGNILHMAENQENVMAIINSPAHNPTGHALTSEDWDFVISLFTELAEKGKHMILFADVAYLDYAGPDARDFFSKFSKLHENILVLVEYSMSKGFTMYGLRSGALIAISSSQDVITEFSDINSFTSRATWSNTVRGAQETLCRIWEDEKLRNEWETEKEEYYKLIQERAAIFVEEAKEVGLPILPYKSGFFISVPAKDSKAACKALYDDHIYLVPLAAGVRIAVCAVSKKKMHGIAAKLKAAMERTGQL